MHLFFRKPTLQEKIHIRRKALRICVAHCSICDICPQLLALRLMAQ